MEISLIVRLNIDTKGCDESETAIRAAAVDGISNALEHVRSEHGFSHALDAEIRIDVLEVYDSQGKAF